MSTKKDNFTSKDKKFMKLALDLARARKGLTGDNPSVGCVISKNSKIISKAVTNHSGRPHAEEIAIAKAGSKVSSKTLLYSDLYSLCNPSFNFGAIPSNVDVTIADDILVAEAAISFDASLSILNFC